MLVCVASVYAAPNSRQSNTNCNVNINTNTNMNQDFNSIYGSFSQLTNNQNAGKRILDIEAAVADPTGRDVAGDVAENVDEQDLAEGKLKGYHHNRPRPQSSSINYNSNYNQNNNFDYNSVLASLFEQLTSQQTININEKPIDFLVFSAHPGVHGKSIPATSKFYILCFHQYITITLIFISVLFRSCNTRTLLLSLPV